jgi:hypothetical protein
MATGDRPVHGPMSALEGEIAAWLETVGVDTADTLRTTTSSTIYPTAQRPSTGGKRALAMLEQLAGRSPGASVQLRQGEIIGQGGMGVIRAAEQVALGRTVAVKTLKPDKRSPEAALDLLREAWVTGSIEHPNVVPVHYLGLDDDGSPLIVLKRIEGVEWSDLQGDAEAVRVRFGATDLLAWNLGILMQVLNAVRFAHSRGVVHRDLKPGNVMIGEFGEVYLLDWGIAVSLRDDGSGRLPLASNATDLAGTPSYMAPEMLGREGAPPLSEQTDIYLAGAVLFEIVAGRPPHAGNSAVAVITSVLVSKPELPTGVPAELARIIVRAMAADPAQRFESADALRLALQAYLEHRGSQRLAELARERLEQLLAVLAGAATDPGGAREEIHRLFGACRFGFHEALVAWRDNEDARAGLERATVAVAEYEIACDEPRTAVSLLSELDAPPAALLARAREAVAAQQARHRELERLRRQHDTETGTRTRTFITLILGFLFTAFPLLAALEPRLMVVRTHERWVLWSLGFIAVVLALSFWARDSLSKTVINRRVVIGTLFLFVCQIVLAVVAQRLDVPVLQTELLIMFLWFVIAGMAAIGIDHRLTPCALGYLIALLVAVWHPEHRLYAMAAANLGFTINAVWHWRPERFFRLTPEERAALGRPARAAKRPRQPPP